MRENRYVTSSGDAEAVLVTGVYGAGKSTVVADIGKLLTDRGERYGLLDVDWLGWFDAGRDAASHRRVVMSNITTVCEAYLAEGVRRLALAWSIRDRSQLDEVRQAVSVPMRVVRLDVDAELMRRRLLADPTESARRTTSRSAWNGLRPGTEPAWRTCSYLATGRCGRPARRFADGSRGSPTWKSRRKTSF